MTKAMPVHLKFLNDCRMQKFIQIELDYTDKAILDWMALSV